MRILVLGATGHIGRVLCEKLEKTDWSEPVRASRGRRVPPSRHAHIRVDTRNPSTLTAALQGIDCVVNCVAGDFASIAGGAKILVQSARAANCRRIVHLSSMAVYGRTEGSLGETAASDPDAGWYARAKCEAEAHMAAFARAGGTVVTLRPGCVFGPGSELWVGRIARWLRDRRLGDAGTAADGWSNLVHVNDVCAAIAAALRLRVEPGTMPSFNLAGPDSPRWNEYFVDLGIAVNAVPVPRVSARRIRLDAALAGPPLKIAELLLARIGIRPRWLPEPLSPSLMRLWRQQIHLDATAATQALGLNWTDYATGLKQSSTWFMESSRDTDYSD